MKVYILFVLLFSSLIIGINAEAEKCENYFNVSTCSECQKELWDTWANPSSCGFFINLIKNIIKDYGYAVRHTQLTPYNFTPYDEAVKETCDERFSCTYDEAESSAKRVEEKCSNELSTKVDWSADPLTLNRTVTSAYGTVISFYFGIPDHDVMCFKSSSGDLCGIELTKPLINWLKENIPDGKFRISYDHKFVYKEDGSRLEIPRGIFFCGECQERVVKTFKYWPVNHPLPDYIVKNVYGSWEEEVNNFPNCPNNNSTTKHRRTLNRFSRRKIN
ncbi:hypothetical protein RclHR1_03470017 [Rhizophagus clarus]|uniref:Saposin B-type domain-containing protein n=1 Tax=Rhizophagus clarus TaxID=94130 RepID=A0A2Z6RE64_9GLOM|nr:hypothetical protein RclHR1_03470017 [Rhizophagus clarus]GES76993.1 hypothetical protein GLOIN_2v1788955 [Rhizophagus clarus]